MFQTIQTRDNRVRALPYPFLGAFSISNDIDRSDGHFFEALMKFLNTQATTPFGTGLGLEVTSSIFFYSNHYPFSYFSGVTPQAKRTPWAARIDEYLLTGWIDTNHAYGDFDEGGGFSREHALRYYETLESLGVVIRVFTNHGGEDNVQNIGKDAHYHCGDLQRDQAYHTDLMKQHGVRYIWTDSMTTWKSNWLKWNFKGNARRIITWIKQPFSSKSLLTDCILQDNSRFKGFVRFRSTGPHGPNLSSMGSQIQQIDWEKFYKSQGVIVLYQHLGTLYRNAGIGHQATIEDVCMRPEVFLAPFHFLKREFEKGSLWVCGLSRLLNYIEVVESLAIHHDVTQDRYNILYNGVVERPEITFQGLTFFIDPTRPVQLFYNGYELPLQYNGPDETGRYSVTVPVQKLESIW